jgi:septal ring factor EnvC (AmiA/AmiB activator)
MKKNHFVFAACFLMGFSSPIFAKVSPGTQLEKTKASIANIQQQQKVDSLAVSKLEINLQKTDETLSTLSKQKQELTQRLLVSEKSLADLQGQLEKLDLEAKQLQKQWVKTFKWHYKLGSEPALKMLFSDLSFHDRLRNLHLLQILFQNEQKNLKLLNLKKVEIANTSNSLLEEQQQLAELKNSIEKQNQELLTTKREQDNLIKTRRAAIKNSNVELLSLQTNEKQLTNLITEMAAAATAAANAAEQKQPVQADSSARLPSNLPVQGKVVTRFGQRSDQNLSVSKGLFIAAKEGSSVTSVKSGTVIFSDWLRGYGYLVIVDHGNQYLTLYGHNQNLLKKKQDIVKAGEVIARVGRSGGSDQPGLYFEVRRRGEPVNPERWIKG